MISDIPAECIDASGGIACYRCDPLTPVPTRSLRLGDVAAAYAEHAQQAGHPGDIALWALGAGGDTYVWVPDCTTVLLPVGAKEGSASTGPGLAGLIETPVECAAPAPTGTPDREGSAAGGVHPPSAVDPRAWVPPLVRQAAEFVRTVTPSITCPKCGATSYNPNDIRERYCGRCHWWTSDEQLGAIDPADVGARS